MSESRDRLMEGRIARTLEDMGLAPDQVELVRSAHRLAMEPRIARLGDPHHPDFLHPGRTVLVLVLDAGVRDARTLAAAALVESERPDVRVGAAEIRAQLGPEVAQAVAAVPLPGDGAAEALITAPRDACLVALAERLDHCRHAKFWGDRPAQERIHAEARTVYGPVAERIDGALARRFAHWSEAFGRTLARGASRAGE